MASATRKTVEKTITEDVFVLELTKDEAEWLRDVMDGYGPDGRFSGPIAKALDAPTETEGRPIEGGEKVRITEDAYDYNCVGRVGTVGRIDETDPIGRYRVDFSDGDYVWAKSVERVND